MTDEAEVSVVDEPEVRFIEGQFHRVALDESDLVVLCYPQMLSGRAASQIRTMASEVFHCKVVILDGGAQVGVIRKIEVKDRCPECGQERDHD